MLKELAKTDIPTKHGSFQMIAFDSGFKDLPHILLISESFKLEKTPLVRIHSECMTGDLFGSNRCECGEQLEFSKKMIAEKGGMILYLRQEGRGIGLVNKMKAYNLQDQGLKTIEANVALGFHEDARDFTIAIDILKDKGIKKVKLLTNNPKKINIFTDSGIEIEERIAIEIESKPANKGYLKTKKEQMGHLLNHI